MTPQEKMQGIVISAHEYGHYDFSLPPIIALDRPLRRYSASVSNSLLTYTVADLHDGRWTRESRISPEEMFDAVRELCGLQDAWLKQWS